MPASGAVLLLTHHSVALHPNASTRSSQTNYPQTALISSPTQNSWVQVGGTKLDEATLLGPGEAGHLGFLNMFPN